MINTNDFILLVDNKCKALVSSTTDFDLTIEKLGNTITDLIKESKVNICNECRELTEKLVIKENLENIDLSKYIFVIDNIRDRIQANNKNHRQMTSEDLDLWINLLEKSASILAYSLKSGRNYFDSDYVKMIEKSYFDALLISIRILDNYGLKVPMNDYSLQLTSSYLSQVLERMNSFAREIGGENIIKTVFSEITKFYDPQLDRYIIGRPDITKNINTTVKPQIPLNLLLRLGWMFLEKRDEIDSKIEPKMNQLIDLVTAIIVLHKLQPFNPFEHLILPPISEIFAYLQKLALYDNAFLPPQQRITTTIRIIDTLFSEHSTEVFPLQAGNRSHVTLGNFIDVIKVILERNSNRRCVWFSLEDAYEWVNHAINRDQLEIILDFMSSEQITAPQDSVMTDIFAIETDDILYYPLKKSSGNNFFFLDGRICSIGFIETLLRAYRDDQPDFIKGKDIDDWFGGQFEKALGLVFTSHGIRFKRGHYDFKGKSEEADFILESDEYIVFIECKKKSFARPARSGNSFKILTDFVSSMFYALNQTFKHGKALNELAALNLYQQIKREKGQPRNKNKTICDTVIHENDTGNRKTVIRIAASLFDLGSFQWNVDDQFISVLARSKASITGPPSDELQKSVDTLNSTLSATAKHLEYIWEFLAKKQNSRWKAELLNCHFASFPFLVELATDTTNADSFINVISKIRSFRTYTGDKYILKTTRENIETGRK